MFLKSEPSARFFVFLIELLPSLQLLPVCEKAHFLLKTYRQQYVAGKQHLYIKIYTQ